MVIVVLDTKYHSDLFQPQGNLIRDFLFRTRRSRDFRTNEGELRRTADTRTKDVRIPRLVD